MRALRGETSLLLSKNPTRSRVVCIRRLIYMISSRSTELLALDQCMEVYIYIASFGCTLRTDDEDDMTMRMSE